MVQIGRVNALNQHNDKLQEARGNQIQWGLVEIGIEAGAV